MDVGQSVAMSWQSIRGHALRSALTTLGVVIGVAAVITFVTLGASLQAEVLGQVGGAQATTINVFAGPQAQGGPPGVSAQPVFTEHDVQQLAGIDGVASVVPQGVVSTAAVSLGNDTVAQRQVITTTPAFFADQSFQSGQAFESGAREIVLNPAAAALFRRNATVGDQVAVTLASGRTVNATVVGILAEAGGQGLFAQFGSQPQIYVPADPFYTTRVTSPATGQPERVYPTLTVQAASAEQVSTVQPRVRAYLENESDAAQLVPRGYAFTVQTNQQLVDQVRDLLNTLTGFVTGIAVIALVVGSIGIANIMLVSVTERTREIGIMKAVGAQNRDVLQLFLFEAVVLGVLGAALGTVVGVAGGYVATEYVGLPLVFPPQWAAIAVVVGVLVGVVAGLYPAWNAARTDPIDALRYE